MTGNEGTTKFSRRSMLGWMTGKSPRELKLKETILLHNARSLITNLPRDPSFIVPPLELGQEDDDAKWLPDGWKKYKPADGTETMQKADVEKLSVVSSPDLFHLPNLTTLESYTSKEFLNQIGYPSLAQFYGDDHRDVKVNVIYATSTVKNDTEVAHTRARITGNKVEYGIAIRLNPPILKKFNDVNELRRWIAAAYAHENVHVRQMHKRHTELLARNPFASSSDIEREISGHLISDEAEAYWAWMTYGKKIIPSWFSEEPSPFNLDLKAPFLKLQKTSLDPLIDGEYTNHPVYDEKALEALWFYTSFFYLYNDELIESSKIDPRLISTIEICNREGLITNREFEEYLKGINTTQSNAYLLQKSWHKSDRPPSIPLAIGGLAAVGVAVTALILFRKFGSQRE